MKPLIVMALPIENVAGQLDAFGEIVYTGVGKVNAACHLAERLSERRAQQGLPRVVINLGSAGAQRRPTGSVVLCTQVVQRDMDATALGFAWGQTPFETHQVLPLTLPQDWPALGLPEATCYSGDQFVTTPHAYFELDVVDMEAYALARVCKHFAVDFVCIKYITDGADGQAAQDWPSALAQASSALAQVLQQVLALGYKL